MSVNVELLDQTLAHIEANRNEWTQHTWRCETGMCFAGWAAQLAGGTWVSEHDVHLVPTSDDPKFHIVEWSGGVRAYDRARRQLGIGHHQAEELFAAGNDLDDLRRIVAEIKAGAS